MKQRKLAIAAGACGLFCAVCAVAFMGIIRSQAEEQRVDALARFGGEQVEVYSATRDIAAGERINASDVEVKLWVADLLPAGAMGKEEDVVGLTASSPILKGEVISKRRFEHGEGRLAVPDGKAAVSVPAKAVSAVGGALEPGMSVDVYATGATTTSLIAEGVSVLATSSGGSSAQLVDLSWITLAVDPGKVSELVAASNTSSLYFVLPGNASPTSKEAGK